MKKQQQFLHTVSVMVTLFAVLLFYLLGGGSAVGSSTAAAPVAVGVNVQLPQATNQELSGGRIEAMQRMQAEEDANMRTHAKQQSSSFRWLQQDTTAKPMAEEKTVQPPVRTVASGRSVAAPTAVRVGRRPPKPINVDSVIAVKQREFEQKHGISITTGEATTALSGLANEPTSLATVVQPMHAGFYGLASDANPTAPIRAVVHGVHKNLQQGAIVKLRLLDAIEIEHTQIPPNTFLYGKLSLASCRAMIKIQNIQYQNRIFPFSGTIYDKDGFEGLYVPDNHIDEATRKAGAQVIGSANLQLPLPSLIGAAANTAISAAQSVAQSVVSQQKITISSNYLVTIKQQ